MRRGIALLVLLLVLAAGCATKQPVYEKDGVRYGVTQGPFRGRWWNYYERGRSFLDGGFYAEARRDFALALRERDRDQRWARTYGLHFAPQYFPNREYGVALYGAGDFTGALDALERSYAQQPSARAAYYLREVRKALSTDDTTPPALEVTPSGGEGAVSNRSVDLAIDASDTSYVASIAVDGRPLEIGKPAATVHEQAVMTARPGSNDILVRAVDVAGNVAEKRVFFSGDFDGPVVSFDEPVSLPGVVSGVVADPAGVTALTVAGVDAALSPGADGMTRFRVELAAKDLKAPLSFSARDGLGNASRGTVPLGVLHVAEIPTGLVLASGPVTVHLAPHVTALFQGGQLVAVARTPDTGTAPSVHFGNLAEGQRYLMDEIVVDLEVSGPAGIKRVTINGTSVACLPGRTHQRVSRRVALPKEGPATIRAVVEDASGARGETSVTVQRALTDVEQLSNKLSLALLGNIWEGPNRGTDAEETFISDELTRVLYEQGRFDLLSRDALPQILTEQELAAALGGRNGALPLRDLVPAELMVAGLVRRDTDSIEIILEAISPDTSQLMGYADVAGTAKTKDELCALVADLALRFTQDFPKVQGDVADVRSQTKIYATLSRADRVRPNMKCLICRHGPPVIDPATGAELGRPAEILAEGWLADVADALSLVRVGAAKNGSERGIEVHDFVVTK